MSIRMTQKSYKVSTSGPGAPSSRSFTELGPAVRSAPRASPSEQQWLRWPGCRLCWGQAASLEASPPHHQPEPLNPIKLDVDPKIQAVRTQGRSHDQDPQQQVCFLHRPGRFLEQQNKMLETKWEPPTAAEETARANMERHVRELHQQPEAAAGDSGPGEN
ncbi:Keratin, type II cytoskeletal 8 [Plecturocebus cupreus]